MKNWIKTSLLVLAGVAMVLVPLAYAATTYTSSICIPKPTPGDAASQNTWGALLNTGADIIDAITSKATSISVAGASNVVLTFSCGSLDQTDSAHFIFTGVLTGNINVLWPATRNRTFSVTNSTTGSFTLSLGANNGSSAPAGQVVTVPQGATGLYYSNGTDVKVRESSGGLTIAANSVVGNMTASAAAGTDIAVPDCSGALTYASGSGFGCGSGGGGGGGGLTFGGTQTTDFNAIAGITYCLDSSGGSFTMTLPSTPVVGNQIGFADCNSSLQTHAVTVANNSNILMGFNANMTVSTANAAATLIYSGVSLGWRMF